MAVHWMSVFLSTPSARRATGHFGFLLFFFGISIHALREEGDLSRSTSKVNRSVFLSTPSARRATRGGRGGQPELRKTFLSTPSARRATHKVYAQVPTEDISIHALREEGDADQEAMKLLQTKFLSTPSARRATVVYPVYRSGS